MPKPPLRTLLITAVKFVILVAILYWLVSTFPRKDWDALVERPKNWWILTQAFVLVLLAHGVSYWRWQILVHALEVPFRLLEAIRLGVLGTLLNQISIGSVGGDLFKAIEAARNAPGKKTEVVTSVLVDRAIGLLGLVLVASISLFFATDLSPRMTAIFYGGMILSVVGVGGLFSIVILGDRIPTKWLASLPVVGHTAYRIAKACMIFRNRPRLVLELVSASMVVHSCFTLACALISHALYSDAVPTLAQHFMAIPPAMAASTLPLTPGGVGVQEAVIKELFAELKGIPEGYSALIMAGVFRILLLGVSVIGAIYFFIGIGEKKKMQKSSK